MKERQIEKERNRDRERAREKEGERESERQRGERVLSRFTVYLAGGKEDSVLEHEFGHNKCKDLATVHVHH